MDSSEVTSRKSEDREQQYDEFVALLARHDLAIRRFVRFLLPSGDGVDDVIQETALECWKKFTDFQPESADSTADDFVRWACVIARFKAMSWQRDRKRDRLVFRDGVIEQLAQAALDALDQQDEERRAVEACLDQLPPDQRRLVLSVHSPSESIARIAKETGENARRLYSRVNVLRTLLLNCVERRLAGEAGNG
ncbi:sigma-70 family RNA polymerase sigma factor [Rubinisphaera margarita]|uniref:sigma-70 family RNA polymerase sigma factor n=1 Tax=Rubinisphaera margarita TaxID=2909586 RepID=UPI001EE99D56|nr:sigma-70 family RNA polymerase sigma factor [Rubinisphaera margarita]MCG6154395.1 sigma-70 family RNA polymerase sigma factor [Rubinisphaera margarita]